MSSANSDSFASLFPIWRLFLSFSCLIALARTSVTMLSHSGESSYPCLAPDLKEKGFNFSLLSILAENVSYMAFIMLRYFPSHPFY